MTTLLIARKPLGLSTKALSPSRFISIFDLSQPIEKDVESSPTPLRILARCEELHASIQPLNDRVRGPLERHSYKTTALPFVLLLGNHSSGKSSFVNYILQRQVQASGVAPTDDSFTIIAPGKVDVDQDGPSLVGDPDMGFSGLRHFGPPLVHHMQLKLRKDTAVSNFMLVDSPGMIDSPVTKDSDFTRGDDAFDRGYDFEGTVKWFAERADVILLFFDPDKPGTTGETLRVMTKSLAGTDHKLHIVLNKADQFKKIHDFARAYGSLCWNLSKVIPRKDLPRIHTMCLPVASSQSATSSLEMENMGSGLADLHKTRDVVVSEVFQAPKRRIDNMITRLADSVQLLSMHATISDKISSAYRRQRMICYAQLSGVVMSSSSLLGGSIYYQLPMEANVTLGITGLLGSAFTFWYTSKVMEDEEKRLLSANGLNMMFETTYAGQISEGDAWIISDWSRIRDRLQLNLRGTGLKNTSTVSANELKELKNILDEEIPKLRRLAAPIDYSEMVKEGFSK